jgi:hypothetical protein
LDFDKDAWIDECKRVKASDSSPCYRDEQRAFYNIHREQMLRKAIEEIQTAEWKRIDAIVFPGGFFGSKYFYRTSGLL